MFIQHIPGNIPHVSAHICNNNNKKFLITMYCISSAQLFINISSINVFMHVMASANRTWHKQNCLFFHFSYILYSYLLVCLLKFVELFSREFLYKSWKTLSSSTYSSCTQTLLTIFQKRKKNFQNIFAVSSFFTNEIQIFSPFDVVDLNSMHFIYK